MRPPRRPVVKATSILLLAAACQYLNQRETGYASIGDARAAGAVERGWVPAFLPASAHEIRERHDVNSNDGWGRFEFDARDRSPLESACRRVDAREVRFPGAETRGTLWWAQLLRADPSTVAEHFDLFECLPTAASGHRFLAIHHRLPTAFFWSSRALTPRETR